MNTKNKDGWNSGVYPIKEVDHVRCLEKLKQVGEIRAYPKGALIFDAGMPIESCFIVLEGMVTAQVSSASGTENLYIAHRAGMVGLEAQCFCEWSETAQFHATEPTQALILKRSDLLRAMERDFELSLFFIGTLSLKFRWYVEHARNLSSRSALRRCCDLLVEMCDQHGEIEGNACRFRRKISQEEIGKRLHVNRLTVIRCMKDLRKEKLIETVNGHIYIPDIGALFDFRDDIG